MNRAPQAVSWSMYGNKLNLSLEEIDSIIRQGKALGVYMYIYTGGEPLVPFPTGM